MNFLKFIRNAGLMAIAITVFGPFGILGLSGIVVAFILLVGLALLDWKREKKRNPAARIDPNTFKL